MTGKFIYACAILMMAMIGTLAVSDSAEARRYRGHNGGDGWEAGRYDEEIYPQARSSRSSKCSTNNCARI
ncbi:MAG: hypothetical protein J0I48_09355 [Devosia sp.]|nr:hypothetical protein [Devosia sp.]